MTILTFKPSTPTTIQPFIDASKHSFLVFALSYFITIAFHVLGLACEAATEPFESNACRYLALGTHTRPARDVAAVLTAYALLLKIHICPKPESACFMLATVGYARYMCEYILEGIF